MDPCKARHFPDATQHLHMSNLTVSNITNVTSLSPRTVPGELLSYTHSNMTGMFFFPCTYTYIQHKMSNW